MIELKELLQTGQTKIPLGKLYFKVNSTIERSNDHLYSNKPDKLSNIEVIKDTTSDHYPVSLIRDKKNIILNK